MKALQRFKSNSKIDIYSPQLELDIKDPNSNITLFYLKMALGKMHDVGRPILVVGVI